MGSDKGKICVCTHHNNLINSSELTEFFSVFGNTPNLTTVDITNTLTLSTLKDDNTSE